jgi:site-specific DNA-methyltransferase (adenine-specific)
MPIVDTLWAEGSGAKELGDHPLQQAAEPFELLVEMATPPGALVVDPFLGSGTTATACVTIEWWIIGVDADPGVIALAHERLRSGPR